MAIVSMFSVARQQQDIALIEFEHFRRLAIANVSMVCSSVARFEAVEREFSFFILHDEDATRLQINFGRRKMLAHGETAIEQGPRLLYSLGHTGGVCFTVLYPATSPLGNVEEDHIFLRIGRYTGYQLYKRMRSDIADLVAYAFCEQP